MGESKRKRIRAEEALQRCAGVQDSGSLGDIECRHPDGSARLLYRIYRAHRPLFTLDSNLSVDLQQPERPGIADVLGTWMLSILAGHKRYAHVTVIRGDGVNPGLLEMNKVISEDALRRALSAIPEDKGLTWLDRHLSDSVIPLLDVPWILDIDTTVKPLYGKQEGAVVSYNPKKPGRPSHSYHTYLMAGLRLLLGVEVKAGNEHTGSHSLPGFLQVLDHLPEDRRPTIVRGDCGFGSDTLMRPLEERQQGYLFKLKLTKHVKRLIERLFRERDWTDAGQDWEGRESELRLDRLGIASPCGGATPSLERGNADCSRRLQRTTATRLHRGRSQARQADDRLRICRVGDQS